MKVTPDMKRHLEKAIDAFSRNEGQTQTSTVTVGGQKFFIKVCGRTRGKYKDNEVDSLQCLSKLSPFYADYYVTSMNKDDKTGIMMKYIDGTDMYEMIKSKSKWEVPFLIRIFKLLLAKIRVFHNNLLTHGDIKATNFYIHSHVSTLTPTSQPLPNPTLPDMDIDLIDTESVNNFNTDHRKQNAGKYVNFVSANYDFPVKLKRGRIVFASHKNAFFFYKFLDLYAIAVLILFLYRPQVYTLLKTKGQPENVWMIGKRQRRPTEFVEKQSNNLERALFYVFSFLPYVEKSGDKVRIENIPISHSRIVEILDEKVDE